MSGVPLSALECSAEDTASKSGFLASRKSGGPPPGTARDIGVPPQEGLPERTATTLLAGRRTCRGQEIRASRASASTSRGAAPGIASISGKQADGGDAPGPVGFVREVRATSRVPERLPIRADKHRRPPAGARKHLSTTRSTTSRFALGA